MPAHPAITFHSHVATDANPFYLQTEDFLLLSQARTTVSSGIQERRVDTSGNCFLRVEADQRMEFSVSGAVLSQTGLANYHPGRSLSSSSLEFLTGGFDGTNVISMGHQFLEDGIYIYESATSTDGQGVLRDIDISISYDMHTGLDINVPAIIENPVEGSTGATGYSDVPNQVPVDIATQVKRKALKAIFNRTTDMDGILKVHLYDDATLLDTHTQDTGDFWKTNQDATIDADATAVFAKLATTVNVNLPDGIIPGQILDEYYYIIPGDIILVKNQTNAAENGIYISGPAGEASRHEDFDETNLSEFRHVICNVTEGIANGGKTFRTRNPAGGNLGTTQIDWTDCRYVSNLSPNEPIKFQSTGGERKVTKIVVQRYTTSETDCVIATIDIPLPYWTIPAKKIPRIPISAIKLSMRHPYEGTLTTAAGYNEYGNTSFYPTPAVVWGGYILGGNESTHLASSECVDVTAFIEDEGTSLLAYKTVRVARSPYYWEVHPINPEVVLVHDVNFEKTPTAIILKSAFVTPCNGSQLILMKDDLSIALPIDNQVAIPDGSPNYYLKLDLNA